jgi:hypothetical protein
MVLLNSLKLTPYEPTNRSNSFLKRRRKLIAKIDEQILLATDSNYKPTKIKWVHTVCLLNKDCCHDAYAFTRNQLAGTRKYKSIDLTESQPMRAYRDRISEILHTSHRTGDTENELQPYQVELDSDAK